MGAAIVAAVVAIRVYLLSFRAQRIDDYVGLAPEFDLRRQLNGPLICEGVIFGPGGRVSSRFTARMVGDWSGNSGVLRQDFLYDNGETQERAWHLELGPDGSIDARADDVPGTAKGGQGGPAVHLKYPIRLPKEAGGHVLGATDWMYLVEDGSIINRSQFRKFGFKVAELIATIRREETT